MNKAAARAWAALKSGPVAKNRAALKLIAIASKAKTRMARTKAIAKLRTAMKKRSNAKTRARQEYEAVRQMYWERPVESRPGQSFRKRQKGLKSLYVLTKFESIPGPNGKMRPYEESEGLTEKAMLREIRKQRSGKARALRAERAGRIPEKSQAFNGKTGCRA